ncbi:response regulator transcription factor [Streptomyces sp. TBY4]|uniref:response regulator transcription factor n=1 Tax=Streptomyces sp. TBY4 TaxID=2962030 RepID=UPI0020B7059E|nr:response regulator transcription factor [Streptomyces sp. TBY4]MCP3760569.1 response regulator transcription factor [Streptomyces sp. TBY4]
MGANEHGRAALERRIAAMDGFVVLPNDRKQLEDADVVIVAADGTGFRTIRRIASQLVGVHPPLLLVVDKPFEELVCLPWLGARGIVLSSAPDRELADSACLVAQRGTVVSEEIFTGERLSSGHLALEWALNRDAQATLEALSARELEVLGLVGTGRSNAEIADRLWVSSNTIRSHVQRLMRKLGLQSRLCLVIFAHELGLVNVDDIVMSSDESVPAGRPVD